MPKTVVKDKSTLKKGFYKGTRWIPTNGGRKRGKNSPRGQRHFRISDADEARMMEGYRLLKERNPEIKTVSDYIRFLATTVGDTNLETLNEILQIEREKVQLLKESVAISNRAMTEINKLQSDFRSIRNGFDQLKKKKDKTADERYITDTLANNLTAFTRAILGNPSPLSSIKIAIFEVQRVLKTSVIKRPLSTQLPVNQVPKKGE